MLPHLFTAPLRVVDLFSDPFRFAVPSYQRRYSWTVKEAGQLLEDIQLALGDDVEPAEDDYFLGAILLTDAGGGSSWDHGLARSPRLLDIVDGQQRLITLVILLAVLRDLQGEAPPGCNLAATIIVPQEEKAGSSPYRIQLRGADNEFLVHYVLGGGACRKTPELVGDRDEGEDAIFAVREHFVTELDPLSTEDRERLKDYVLQCCHAVAIVTTDIDHGHRMFSVLNDRGRPLARKDIIKAEVLGDCPPGGLEAAYRHWSDAELLLGSDFDTFFSHVRVVRGQAKLAIIAGIRAVKDEVGGSEPFISDVLLPLAEAFDLIRQPHHSGAPQSPLIGQRLTYLGWLGSSEWIPSAMLWLSQHRHSPAEMLRFLEIVDRFAYSLRLLCIGAGKRAARFSGVLPAIRRGTVLDPERSPCMLSRDEHRHISYNLRNLHERHPQTCKLVLLRLNDELAGSPQNLEPSEWTVEHVLPQSPGRSSQWRTWFPEPDERERLTHSLGNFVLVKRSQNDRASNQDLERKLAIYFDSASGDMPAITREIEAVREWGPAQIKAREERFVRILSDIWGLELAWVNGTDLPRGLRRRRPRT